MTLDKPRHVDVTGTDAYVIVPTNLSYKKKGQLVKEAGLMTLVRRSRLAHCRLVVD